MDICVIGHTGLVGQTVYKYFEQEHTVFGINRKRKTLPKQAFDVVINCAGNAKKYFAEYDPAADFRINTEAFSVALELNCKKLVHISTIEATPTNTNYAKSKNIIEQCCQLYFPGSVILRPAGIIGEGLKKNVIFDIENNRRLFVTGDSTFNYISTQAIAEIIDTIIKLDIRSKIFNVAATKAVSVEKAIEIAKDNSINFTERTGPQKESYSYIDIRELKQIYVPKTSEEYVEEYFYNKASNLP